MSTLERELAIAIEHEDLDAVIAALAKRGSGTAAIGADPGTVNVPDIPLAAKLIRSHTRSPKDRFCWVRQLLMQQDFSGHQLGPALLSDVQDQKPTSASNGSQATPINVV